MATLSEYISSSEKRTPKEWAEFFGISRSYFVELANGTHVPSAKLMVSIQQKTGGAVTPNDWIGDQQKVAS